MADNADLEQLWHDHHRNIFGYLYREVRDPELADDLRSRVYMKAVAATANGNGCKSENPRGWIFSIAHSVLTDLYRTKQRKGKYGTVVNFDEIAEQASPELSPHECYERAVLHEQVRYVLTRLPEKQAKAIELHMIDGHTNSETGEMLGVSEGAAKALGMRGMVSMHRTCYRLGELVTP